MRPRRIGTSGAVDVKAIGRFALRHMSALSRLPAGERAAASLEMFLAALQGRGGGSGWDSAGQVAILARMAKPAKGAVIVDVGANNGHWSRGLSARLGDPSAQFHLFECAPYCFDPLADSAARIGNARVVHKAVSETSGRQVLHLPDTRPGTGSGLASLHARKDTSVHQHDYKTLEVETVCLDDYVAEAGLARIDILKIDVEGHELAVLKGAQRTLAQGLVGCIFFEFGSGNVNSRTYFRDFWELLTPMGYAFFRVLPGGRALPVGEYADMCEYFRGATNYICLRAPAG